MVCARLSFASRGTLCAALCTAVSALFTPRDGSAQNARPDSARPRPRPTSSQGRLAVTGCSGQPISDIVILSQPPFKDRLPAQLEWGRTLARTLHMETRDDVIRRFLLFKIGDACNQIKRAESERILRAQPFIVDARIRAYDDEKGGVRLEVETRDDFTLILEPRVRASSPQFRGIRLGDANVNGSAKLAAVEWRDGLAYNDVWGVEYSDYQFGGGRNELHAVARRNTFGQRLELEVVRPYYTDLQRFAWQAFIGGTRDPQRLFRSGYPDNAVNVSRRYSNLSVLARVGPVGRLKLIGLSLTREQTHADSNTIMLTPEGVRPDTIRAAPLDFRRQNVARVNLLVGMRAIRFVTVQGFDALTGTQDVRVGAQVGLVGGQSVRLGPDYDSDRFFSSNIYIGAGNEQWFMAVQGITEARYDLEAQRLRNIISSGHAAWYFRPAIRQTTILEANWATGRRMQSPFQVSLADPDGGVMGHRASRDPGARRLVLRGEQRLVVPTRFNVADMGLAAFVEAGRLWAERSVPYSVDSPWRGAVGVSVLAAVPPRSRRLWRLDLGVPVSSDPRRRFEMRITSFDRSRTFWREPNDVTISRERTAPSSLFTWP